MKQEAVSEVIGALILVGIAVLAAGILLVVLFANPLPTRVPSFHGLISSSGNTVYISHEGGDTLYRGQYRILVDGADETWSFVKSLPDANRTFSLGAVMNATLPSIANRVVMVYNTSWGGGTVLLSATLQVSSGCVMLSPTLGDAYLFSTDPDTPAGRHGAETTLYVRSNSAGNQRSVLRFDLSGIPAGSSVSSATLRLYKYFGLSESGRTYNIHRVTSDWAEAYVNWPRRTASNLWNTGGGDYSATVYDQLTVPAPDDWVQWSNLVTLVQGWVSGTYDNYGLLIKDSAESDVSDRYSAFRSKEQGSNMPNLTVCYSPTPAGWYNSGWYYRKKIFIDHTKVPSDQSDFPVLVSFTDAELNDALVQSDGDDLLFTSADGMTKLPHEIEIFTKNTGVLVGWVKVPALSSVSDTVIYLYYGNTDTSSMQDPANVWTNSYAGVWHLGEATGAGRLDSTGNNNDLTQNNGPIAMSSSGKIGNAADFVRASSQYLYITDAAQTGLDLPGTLTLEAWAKVDETANAPYQIISKARGSCASGDPPYFLRLNSIAAGFVRECTVVTGVCGTDPTDAQPGSNSITAGTWNFVVGTNDGSFTRVYKNGVQSDAEAYSLGSFNSDGAFYVGSQVNANYFDGLLDEVRVSSVARSQDWITTEYNNQNNPGVGGFLVSISSEQTKTTMS